MLVITRGPCHGPSLLHLAAGVLAAGTISHGDPASQKAESFNKSLGRVGALPKKTTRKRLILCVNLHIYIYIYNYIYIYIYIYICVSQSTFCENMTTSKHVDFPANSTIFLSQLAVPSLLRAGDVFRVYGSADLPMNQRVANLGLSLKTFWSKKRSTKMPVLSKNHQNHHVKYGKNRNHEKYRISRHVIIFLPVQPVFFLSEQRFPMENTDTAWASFSVLPRVVQSL